MLSPKYYLFYKVCAIIAALIVMMWWLKVPDEEINSTETNKECKNEIESDQRSTQPCDFGRK